jgi:uncharacterized protein with ParB-like and HNH nuclease domain
MSVQEDEENRTDANWVDPVDAQENDSAFPTEYKITSSPNDFNVKTLFDFIETRSIKIPGFQRNYVWDIKQASRLIESIMMGIPIPQLFFYEKGRNDFLVIDGQQRLMTIFYFMKEKFPREEKRAELRRIFDEEGSIPAQYLSNLEYFTRFDLKLGKRSNGERSRFEDLNYQTLNEDDRFTLNLRTIRCVVILQHEPKDDSSMYEIFYRLNSGGINLTPQEIRMSLYYSGFFDMLNRVNLDNRWRRLTRPEPDLHLRDVEILLRGFAMLTDGKTYKPPMMRFLNEFAKRSKILKEEETKYYESLFLSFVERCRTLPSEAFISRIGRFSASMYEAIFTAACESAFAKKSVDVREIDAARLEKLKNDPQFIEASRYLTTSKENVDLRYQKAKEILFS